VASDNLALLDIAVAHPFVGNEAHAIPASQRFLAQSVSLVVGLAFVVMLGLEADSARAQTSARPPDLMKLPPIINLGATTFRDGFLPTNPGCAYFQYFRRNSWNEIHDKDGHDVAAFKRLDIEATAGASQLACATPIKIFAGTLGFETLVPIANLSSSSNPSGIVLQDNGFGLGDIFFATYLQMPPVMQNGRPIYSQRFELTFIAPVGKFDSDKDLNQGSGYWSVNPYWAATWFPLPKWELTWRAHYLYNFPTTNIATSLVPNVQDLFKSGQAGQAAWVNFTLGYAVTGKASIGLTGYYLRQLTDDQLNGRSYSGGKEEALYMGPGFHYEFNAKNAMNINVYLPVDDENRPSGGFQFNLVYGHIF
jgi:hypothetical protein